MPNFDATKNEAIRQANKMANKAAMGLFMEDNLQRAMLKVHGADESSIDKSVRQLEFLFNPSEIEMTRGLVYKQQATQQKPEESGGGSAKPQEFTGASARTLSINELTFDTYFDKSGTNGARASVRTKYIRPLEKLMRTSDGNDGPIRPPRVLFVWGEFMKDGDEFNGNGWYIEKMTVRYTMFLEDGTPVRAKVKLDLVEASGDTKTEDTGDGSSDDVTSVKVGEWETAFGAVRKAGGKMKHVLKICMMNGVDDPLFCSGKTLTWKKSEFK